MRKLIFIFEPMAAAVTSGALSAKVAGSKIIRPLSKPVEVPTKSKSFDGCSGKGRGDKANPFLNQVV
jgi:hypothetical protein